MNSHDKRLLLIVKIIIPDFQMLFKNHLGQNFLIDISYGCINT